MNRSSPKNNKRTFFRSGNTASIKHLRRVKVPLDDLEIKLAVKLGDGDLTLGIRRAVVFASMRSL